MVLPLVFIVKLGPFALLGCSGGLLLADFGLEEGQELALGLADGPRGQLVPALLIEQVLQRDLPQLVEVGVVEEHVAPRQFTIATRPSNLLHIVLDCSGHVEMDH